MIKNVLRAKDFRSMKRCRAELSQKDPERSIDVSNVNSRRIFDLIDEQHIEEPSLKGRSNICT